jgi:hypothetical protein
MLAAKAPTERPAKLGGVCFSMPGDVSSTIRTRPAIPTAYTRISSSSNRVFRLADLAGVVREWMQVHSVDAVLASSDEALFTISTHETGP